MVIENFNSKQDISNRKQNKMAKRHRQKAAKIKFCNIS